MFLGETKRWLKRVRVETTGMFSEVPASDFKGSMNDNDGERRGWEGVRVG